MNPAQQAILLLRNQMTGDDLYQLDNTELFTFESICQHWQAMAVAERKKRMNTASVTVSRKAGREVLEHQPTLTAIRKWGFQIMAENDSIQIKPRKETKRKLSSTVTFQSARDRHIDELMERVNSMSDEGLIRLLVVAGQNAELYPAQGKQNAVIISMTEWRAAKAEVAA